MNNIFNILINIYFFFKKIFFNFFKKIIELFNSFFRYNLDLKSEDLTINPKFLFTIKIICFVFRLNIKTDEFLHLFIYNNIPINHDKKNKNIKTDNFDFFKYLESLSLSNTTKNLGLKEKQELKPFDKENIFSSDIKKLNENSKTLGTENKLEINNLDLIYHKKLNEIELLQENSTNTTNLDEKLLQSFLNFINIGRPRYHRVTIKHILRIKNGETLIAKRLFENYQTDWEPIFGAKYPNIAPFGKETQFFKKDLLNTEPILVVERINLTEDTSNKTFDFDSFLSKIGFINTNLTRSSEDLDDTVLSTPGSNFGGDFIINPIALLLFFFYSLLEFWLIIKMVILIFGNPLHLILFISNYPMKYYYENLGQFSNTSFLLLGIFCWIFIFLSFILHFLSLWDEEKEDLSLNPLSWFSSSLMDLYSSFLILNIALFVYLDIFFFFDFLITRVFFLGTPGYPNLFALSFSIFLDFIHLLSNNNFYSSYLVNYLSLNIDYSNPKFFQQFNFLDYRFSLVNINNTNPINLNFFSNNFFLSILDHYSNKHFNIFLNNFYYDKLYLKKELIQDIRKYNFLISKYQDIINTGQLYNRGFFGSNFRLDMQKNPDYFLSEKTNYFDWRFQHYLNMWQRSACEDNTSFFHQHDTDYSPNMYYKNSSKRYFILKPNIQMTTYSALYNYNLNNYNNYNLLSLFFLGFDNIKDIYQPFKFIEYDFFKNDNNIFLDFFSKIYTQNFLFLSLPLSFNLDNLFFDSVNDSLQNELNFNRYYYPMRNELKLKNKILPMNFLIIEKSIPINKYNGLLKNNQNFNIGYCYNLKTKIQNWQNFINIIWNNNYHFYFKRSFKTSNSGCIFKNNSLNNHFMTSYKIFIGNKSLENSKIGQYFYNYIPWLNYKFKWLLYPTYTYKRFDTRRAIHTAYSQNFYFSSLLKFYQVHNYRWQQATKYIFFRNTQARNYIIHLLFNKQSYLNYILELLNYIKMNNNLFAEDVNKINIKNKILNIQKKLNNDFFNIKSTTAKNFWFENMYFLKKLSFKNLDKDKKIFVPNLTNTDFRFFQYVTDFRRIKTLHNRSIKNMKFNNYIHFLGPILSRRDVSTVMGFFAPFEYRNQLFLTKSKKDALRFSVFFPVNKVEPLFRNYPENFKRIPFSKNRSYLLGKSWLHFLNTKSFRIKRTKSLSSFGFSGVGRLPKLSRSFFNLLFIQNRLNNFKILKSNFILINLMSFYNFNQQNNKFNLFWNHFLNNKNNFLKKNFSNLKKK